MHKAFNPLNGLHNGQYGLQNAHIVPSAALTNNVHVLSGRASNHEAGMKSSTDHRHVQLRTSTLLILTLATLFSGTNPAPYLGVPFDALLPVRLRGEWGRTVTKPNH